MRQRTILFILLVGRVLGLAFKVCHAVYKVVTYFLFFCFAIYFKFFVHNFCFCELDSTFSIVQCWLFVRCYLFVIGMFPKIMILHFLFFLTFYVLRALLRISTRFSYVRHVALFTVEFVYVIFVALQLGYIGKSLLILVLMMYYLNIFMNLLVLVWAIVPKYLFCYVCIVVFVVFVSIIFCPVFLCRVRRFRLWFLYSWFRCSSIFCWWL